MRTRTAILLGVFLLTQTAAQAASLPRCLYVSSYHAGYEWNDGIEKGMESVLQGKCEIKKFYMDGKCHLDAEFAKVKAREALDVIDSWKPDVVIAADDNASKFLVMPYLKDKPLPVVFCGLNWSAEPYGYPYSNATGMIEVGPIEALSAEVRAVNKNARRGLFLSVDEITQHKEFAMSKKMFSLYGIEVTHTAVLTMSDWETVYKKAQSNYDFVVLGNNAGIKDWDKERARRYVYEHGQLFTAAYLEWMAPYAMLTMAKIADEQGEWSGKVALLILQGTPPSKIPVVANRRWNMFVNTKLLEKSGHSLSPDILRKGMKVE